MKTSHHGFRIRYVGWTSLRDATSARVNIPAQTCCSLPQVTRIPPALLHRGPRSPSGFHWRESHPRVTCESEISERASCCTAPRRRDLGLPSMMEAAPCPEGAAVRGLPQPPRPGTARLWNGTLLVNSHRRLQPQPAREGGGARE